MTALASPLDGPEVLAEMERLTRTNAEFAERIAALDRVSAEKSALLGMLAHDLRTPISVILGHVEMLRTVAATEAARDRRESVDVVKRAARQMLRILDLQLDWSAIEAGALRLTRQLVDPVAVAADALALAGLAAAQKRVDLVLEEEPHLPRIEVDSGRLGQLLGNLVSNALKSSPSGERVRLCVSRRGDDTVEFAVIDRGPGITPDLLSRIFRPFETGGHAPANEARAMGLGLAIVKRIVDAHGGTLRVESEPGGGSTFRVALPICAPRPAADAPLSLDG